MISPERLTAAVRERLPLVGPLVPVERSGAWSRAFTASALVDGTEAPVVVRVGSHLDDFAKDALASGWECPQLPVPPAYAIFPVDDEFAMVTGRRYGVFLEDLDASAWGRALPHVFDAVDALRAVPLVAAAPADVDTGGLDLPFDPAIVGVTRPWREWLTDLQDDPSARGGGWAPRLAGSPTGDHSFHAGLEFLHGLVDGVEPPRSFVHSDLLHGNVLAAADGSRIEAIFDWGCLFAGDYLYDIAWLDFWAPWHPGLAAHDVPALARQRFAGSDPQAGLFDVRLRACAVHIGLCHLAYFAFVDNPAQIAATDRRLAQYDGRAGS
ncbi:phosphotransferase [Branchiibius cervicis]|uniref:Phosphotransferase n=1 Tax=Branchiibius cervicis TaxID=908252 RepID=A0ABW2ANE3_9MICO